MSVGEVVLIVLFLLGVVYIFLGGIDILHGYTFGGKDSKEEGRKKLGGGLALVIFIILYQFFT